MSNIRSFVDYVFRDYFVGEKHSFIIAKMIGEINDTLESLELDNSKQSILQAYNHLGGENYLNREYLHKYDLIRFNNKIRKSLVFNLIVSSVGLPVFYILFAIFLLAIMFSDPYYNYRGSFLGFGDLQLRDLIFAYTFCVSLIFYVGNMYLLISEKFVSSRINRVISLILMFITFPFGLLLLKYNSFMYKNSYYDSKDKIINISSVVISSLWLIFILFSFSPFLQHDAEKYNYQTADHYSVYGDVGYISLDDAEYLSISDAIMDMTYNSKTGDIYDIHVGQIHLDISEMDIKENTSVFGEIYINDHKLCKSLVNITNSSYNQLYCNSTGIYREPYSNDEEIDLNYIEVLIKITYTNSSNQDIEEEYIIMKIYNLDSYKDEFY